MDCVKIVNADEFIAHEKEFISGGKNNARDDAATTASVNKIIADVRAEGDNAVRRYAARFDSAVPDTFEVPVETAKGAWENLKSAEPVLASSLELAADHIRRFGELQKKQLIPFEAEIEPGIFAGQRVIPVDRAAVYVPAGRFPLISSALMGLIPASVAGVGEKVLVSPPGKNALPDHRILAAAYLGGADRIYALGGAQAIAALALGTETIPRMDLIVGPGNKYVAAAKRLLFGEVGIDFIAGPTDVLIISDTSGSSDKVDRVENDARLIAEAGNLTAEAADLIAADMLAQAEHDPDARARALVPDREMAEQIKRALESRLARLSTAATARASLEAGGLIIIYGAREEAVKIANQIAPEHLELHVSSPDKWTGDLRNYGSLFIGSAAAEALGDYSAGINHTLPTSASARFTGGLSVRNFLKTVTTLRCGRDSGYVQSLAAAENIARAEGLVGHAESAALRILHERQPEGL